MSQAELSVSPVLDMVAVVREVLRRGMSINLHMFHGGTNFGFMSGAVAKPSYKALIASYGLSCVYIAFSEKGKFIASKLIWIQMNCKTPVHTLLKVTTREQHRAKLNGQHGGKCILSSVWGIVLQTFYYVQWNLYLCVFILLDYDAPLSEAGEYTPKYHLLRELIGRYSRVWHKLYSFQSNSLAKNKMYAVFLLLQSRQTHEPKHLQCLRFASSALCCSRTSHESS